MADEGTPDDFNLLDFAIREAFNKYDADGSGAIDSKELASLLADLGEAADQIAVATAMEKLDTDGSGRIEWNEFKAWWSEEV